MADVMHAVKQMGKEKITIDQELHLDEDLIRLPGKQLIFV